MTDRAQRSTVFVSYCHSDAVWLQRLQVHLGPLERDDNITIWDDTRIEAGGLWRDDISSVLESAKVAVLLVSADFLNSKFIAENELPPLLRAAKQHGATILPVILSPCRYTDTDQLKDFQAVNDPAKPLVSLRKGNREQVFVNVARAVKQALHGEPATALQSTRGSNDAQSAFDEARTAPAGRSSEPGRGASTDSEAGMTLRQTVASVPKTHAAIVAASSLLLPLLLPDRLIPQQLDVLRPLTSLLIVTAFLFAWVYHEGLRRWHGTFVAIAIVSLLTLAILQIKYVKTLGPITSESRIEHHLVGYQLTPEGERMLKAPDVPPELDEALLVIGPNAIPTMYGTSYDVMRFAYVTVMLTFVFCVVVLMTHQGARAPILRRRVIAGMIMLLGVLPLGLANAQRTDRAKLRDSAVTLETLAREQLALGQDSASWRAIDLFRSAETVRLQVRDSVEAARNHGRVAVVFHGLGLLDSALMYAEAALSRQRRLRDSIGMGRTFVNRGNVLIKTRREKAATADYLAAWGIATAARDSVDMLFAGMNLAWSYQLRRRQGEPLFLRDSALRYYRLSQRLAERQSMASWNARAHLRLGTLFEDHSQLDSAIVHLEAAIKLHDGLDEPLERADALFALGTVYATIPRRDLALTYLRRANDLYVALQDSLGHSKTLTRIRAVELAMARDSLRTRPESLTKQLLELAGTDTLSQAYYRAEAPQLLREHRPDVEHLVELSRNDRPLAAARLLLLMARASNSKLTEGQALVGIALLYIERDSASLALTHLDAALLAFRSVDDHFEQVTALTRMGWVYQRMMGDVVTATVYYQDAAAVRRRVSRAVGSDPNRVSVHEQDVDLYSGWALAAIASAATPLEKALGALGVVERGRAQGLLALLGRSDPRAPSLESPAAHAKQLVRVGRRVTRLAYWLAEDTLLAWLVRPEGSVSMWRTPLIRPSLVRRVADIDAQRNTLARRNTGRDSLAALAHGFRALLVDSAWSGGATSLVNDVAAVLLPPELQQSLPDSGEIVIVPYGALGTIPFGALPDRRGNPLASRYAISYAPSLDVMNRVAVRSTGRAPPSFAHPLIVGNPINPPVEDTVTGGFLAFKQLLGADSTARWLARRLKTKAFTRREATETSVRAMMPGADLIDLQTHGYAYTDPELARLSFVTLTEDRRNDGVLRVRELLDSVPRLRARLVVLSACNTAIGSAQDAEGVIGLARAFLAQGAGGVLITLWAVDDAVTSKLVRAFYTAWLDRSHPTTAEALRVAQGIVRASHPEARHWSAFQLVGR